MQNLSASIEVIDINITIETRGADVERHAVAEMNVVGLPDKAKAGCEPLPVNQRRQCRGDFTVRPLQQTHIEFDRTNAVDRRDVTTELVEIILAGDMAGNSRRAIGCNRKVQRRALVSRGDRAEIRGDFLVVTAAATRTAPRRNRQQAR